MVPKVFVSFFLCIAPKERRHFDDVICHRFYWMGEWWSCHKIICAVLCAAFHLTAIHSIIVTFRSGFYMLDVLRTFYSFIHLRYFMLWNCLCDCIDHTMPVVHFPFFELFFIYLLFYIYIYCCFFFYPFLCVSVALLYSVEFMWIGFLWHWLTAFLDMCLFTLCAWCMILFSRQTFSATAIVCCVRRCQWKWQHWRRWQRKSQNVNRKNIEKRIKMSLTNACERKKP